MFTLPAVLRATLLVFLSGAFLSAPGYALAGTPSAQPAGTDQVLFLNGDRLTGTLLEVTPVSIRLKTAAMGEVTIQWETVAKITSADRWVVLYPQQRFDRSAYLKFSSAVVEKHDGTPAMTLDSQPPLSIRAPSEAEFGDDPPTAHELASCLGPYLETPFARQATAWVLDLSGSPAMINGTQSQQQLGGAMTIDVCEDTKRNHSVFDVGGSHARSWKAGSPSIITDTFDSSFAQQHFFGSPDGAGVYGIAGGYFNSSLGMALQKSFGAGYFSRQYLSGPYFFSYQADVRYFNERLYNTSSSLNLAGARLQGDARYKKGKFSIAAKAWINPMFNDGHALQGLASLGPSLSLKPWVCLGLKEEDDYLGNSPAGKRKNYVSSSLSLSIKHGPDSCK